MSRPCQHTHYQHSVSIEWMRVQVGPNMVQDQRVLRLRVWCRHCKASWLFHGPDGWSTDHPTVSPGLEEARLPILPPLDKLPDRPDRKRRERS